MLMIETAPGEEVVAWGEECRGAGLGGGGGRLDGDHDVCKDFVSEVPTWNAEGKDFRIGVSPAMLNIGLHW